MMFPLNLGTVLVDRVPTGGSTANHVADNCTQAGLYCIGTADGAVVKGMATPMRASGKQSNKSSKRIPKLASQSRHAKASAGLQFTFVLSHKAAVFLWLDHKCDPLAQYLNSPPHYGLSPSNGRVQLP